MLQRLAILPRLELLQRGAALALFFGLTSVPIDAGEQPKKLGAIQQAEPTELGEVVVIAEKASTKVADLVPWLRRLTGRFHYEAHAETLGESGNAESLPAVTGSVDCLGFGPVPGVECTLDARLTSEERPEPATSGELLNIFPAAILYGIDRSMPGIRFMFVNSAGIAEPGSGSLVGDMVVAREKCADTRGSCERITRVTADPEGQVIRIRVDIEVDNSRVAGATIVMRRESAGTPDASARSQP